MGFEQQELDFSGKQKKQFPQIESTDVPKKDPEREEVESEENQGDLYAPYRGKKPKSKNDIEKKH